MKLVEFSVKNPMVGHLLTIILLLGGIVSMVSLKREVFPETNLNLVVIRTAIPDTSPEEVELQITDLIEEELADLEGIDTYTSQSQEGMSYVVVQLDSDYGQKERLISDIQRRVDQIELIDSAKKPVIRSITTAQPVLKICITSMEDDERALRRYADGLKDRIEGLPDVGTVERTGWRDEEFWVEVNLEKLNALDLSIDAIVAALSLRNVNFPGGKLPEGNKEVILRTVGKFHQPEEMEAIIVRSNIDGEIVQLKEVATVKRTYEPDALYSEFEGKRTIILGVKKKNSGDVIDLADRLKALVVAEQEKAEGTFGLAIIDDQSFYVKRRLNVVTNNGLVGIALVLAVLLVFLNWRVAFFTAFGIPFSLLVSFILMIYFGLTINLMTLFGLILVLGMIVDDAIIVGENVYRHIEEGMAPPQAAIVGTQEVSWPVLTTVATTIAAFLPMYFAPDLYADYLGWLVITVIVTLAASLFECLYLMPAHIAEFGRSAEDPRQRNPVRRAGDALINAAGNLYTRGIRVCLRHYIIVLLLVFGAFGGVVWAIKDRVKIDPFPADLIDIVMVSVTTPTGSSLEHTEKILAKFEAEVAALPDRELGNYISYIGRQVGLEGTVRNSGTQYGQVVIYLTPQEERNDRKTATILRELEARWSKIAGVEKFQTEEAKPGPPAGGDIEVKIVGPDFDKLRAFSAEIQEALHARPGVVEIQDDYLDGKDELHVELDHVEVARLGLNFKAVARAVYAAFQGVEATEVREGKESLAVRVRLQEPWRSQAEAIGTLRVPNKQGRMIPLSHVVTLEKRKGLPAISHYQGRRVLTVSANVEEGVTTGTTENFALLDTYANFSVENPGYRLVFAGEFKENQKLLQFMKKALLIAVVIIFSILCLQFKSFIQPFMLLIIIPLGIIAVVVALMLHGKPVSIMAMMGMVGLAGVVVNDAIVLVSFVNAERRRGVECIEALVIGGRKRMRPILLTTVTTVAGLMPVIYGIGGYEPFLVPAAIALAYGLLAASFFTLIVVPCVYYLVDSLVGHSESKPEEPPPAVGSNATHDDSEKLTFVKEVE